MVCTELCGCRPRDDAGARRWSSPRRSSTPGSTDAGRDCPRRRGPDAGVAGAAAALSRLSRRLDDAGSAEATGLIRAFFGLLDRRRASASASSSLLRAISGLPIFQTEPTGYPHVIVPAITAPLGFLVGIGCFDYWFRWAAGTPTIPDDHSQHGADELARLLQVQHRSQGDRDPVHRHHVLLLLHRRPDRDGHARRARPARHADRRSRASSTGSSRPTPR